MGSATLRPNGIISPDTAVVTPSGTAYDATNDSPDDDTSYFTKLAGENWSTLEFGSTTLPADSLVKLIQPRYRARSVGTSGRGETQLRVGPTNLSTTAIAVLDSFSEYDSNPYTNPALTQSDIDNIRLAVRSTIDDIRFSELFIDVTFAEQPTTDALLPTTTQTTSTPLITWQHTPGTDGGPQAAWEVKVYSNAQYTATGFDPDVSTPTWTLSASTASDSVTTGTLAHDTDYRAYVRTAQNVAGTLHWADWDFVAFDIDIVAPEVDTVTVSVDSAFARTAVDIARDTGGEAWDHVELQRMSELNYLSNEVSTFSEDSDANGRADDWDAATTGTVSVTHTLTGGYQRIAVTGLADGEEAMLQTGELFQIGPGESYTAIATIKTPAIAADTVLTLGLRFYDAAGNVESSTLTFLNNALVSSTAQVFVHTAEAPLTASYVAVTVSVRGTTGATSSAATGDFTDVWLVAGGDEIWVDVAGAEDVTPGANDVTIIDNDIPGETPSMYRARALDSSGNAGDWVYALDSYEWEQEQSWIKCPNRPGLSTTFCLAVRPELTRGRRVGIHRVIDAASPTTVSGPLQLRTGTIKIETETRGEELAVMAALSEPVVLFQFLPEYGMDQMWAALGDVRVSYPDDKFLSLAWRTIEVDVTEQDGP